ncbi:putative nuclease HARBI1 [Bacillus rossius redtenbacheri]|uniref:putative nuclease HARBI1 n=1 Tax=Bacillus rossius redtenbacheri TaxID=93214 RepID=UPI002FDEB04B
MLSSGSESEDDVVERLLDLGRQNEIPRRRIYLPRSNPFEEYDDKKFVMRYRLSKETVVRVLAQIEDNLTFNSNRNRPVSPMNQLLLSLRFYATGAFMVVCGDLVGIHKSTVSRIIKRVTYNLAMLGRNVIKMPSNDIERRSVMRSFHSIAGYPGVIGCIDCTHIPIQSPGGNNAELYRNRKQYFSINVQAVCDSNLLLTNVVARWPGFTHDSTIFNQSSIRAQLETGDIPEGVLLGDNGYACNHFLHTPLLQPATRAELRYNSSHKATRNTIERTFGVLKRRFPILAMKLRVKLDTVLQVIVATAVLHNIAIASKEGEAPVDPDVNPGVQAYGPVPVPVQDRPQRIQATAARTALINTVFSD